MLTILVGFEIVLCVCLSFQLTEQWFLGKQGPDFVFPPLHLWTTMDYRGPPWTTMDYHLLGKTISFCFSMKGCTQETELRATVGNLLCFETFLCSQCKRNNIVAAVLSLSEDTSERRLISLLNPWWRSSHRHTRCRRQQVDPAMATAPEWIAQAEAVDGGGGGSGEVETGKEEGSQGVSVPNTNSFIVVSSGAAGNCPINSSLWNGWMQCYMVNKQTHLICWRVFKK